MGIAAYLAILPFRLGPTLQVGKCSVFSPIYLTSIQLTSRCNPCIYTTLFDLQCLALSEYSKTDVVEDGGHGDARNNDEVSGNIFKHI